VRIKRYRSRKDGASLVEVLAGLFIIIPLFLCIIDLSAIVVGQIVNDALAKRAARAAAQKKTAGAANAAATTIVSSYQVNGIVTQAQLHNLTFNPSNSGNVQIETRVRINVPAPIPIVPLFTNGRFMHARATEPIVMLRAEVP
jgi:Flp pilus assembly protein TadG